MANTRPFRAIARAPVSRRHVEPGHEQSIAPGPLQGSSRPSSTFSLVSMLTAEINPMGSRRRRNLRPAGIDSSRE
jgi:hypothetical protein